MGLAHCQMIASFAGEKKEAQKDGGSAKEVEVLKAKLSAYEELARAVAAIQTFKVPENEEPKPKAKAKAKARVKKERKSADANATSDANGTAVSKNPVVAADIPPRE